MTTEIIINGLSLDLYKDEGISMKFTSKDLQDISKVFSPFSQDFTFPYTAKNARAFGFFGSTDVVKSNLENKFPCKILTNGMLSQSGFLILNNLKYENGKPTDFSGSFGTTMTNLKDRIGDLTLNDLNEFPIEVDLSPNGVYNLIQTPETIVTNGVSVNYYVPLISNLRVWGYGSQLDNIEYGPNTDGILNYEVRPAISLLSIIKMIIKKFELDVTMPLENENVLIDAYVWGNKEVISRKSDIISKRLKFDKQFLPYYSNRPYEIIGDDINATNNPLSFFIDFVNPVTVDGSELKALLVFTFRSSVDNSIICQVNKELTQGSTPTGTPSEALGYLSFPEILAYRGLFYIEMSSTQPFTWQYMSINSEYLQLFTNRFTTSLNNANSADFGGSKLDLIQSLPPTKIIDFLTSFFKTYNISVYDTSPNNENLFWLTPNDVTSVGNVYSKRQVDYTPYLSSLSFTKNSASDYNYYNFKHLTSKYKSNVDFKKQTLKEYGQTFYPEVAPKNAKEFKVETAFSIIPPVTITNTPIVTAYGFDSSEPKYETYGTRYKPNWNELTLFYRKKNYTDINAFRLNYKKDNGSGIPINAPITRYYETSPFNSDNNSLGFSILVFNSIEYHDTIFSRYYDEQIIRLINPNVLSHDFTLELPSTELYLNEALSDVAPLGFRLQNDVIIGENRFSIVDAVIDITTGKTKINLLNYI